MRVRFFITLSFVLLGSNQLQIVSNTIPLPPQSTKKTRKSLPSPALSPPLFNPFHDAYIKFPPNTNHWVTTNVLDELYGAVRPIAWGATVLKLNDPTPKNLYLTNHLPARYDYRLIPKVLFITKQFSKPIGLYLTNGSMTGGKECGLL